MSPLARRLPRRLRAAVAIWIVVPVIVGNTVYDLLVTRGIKEFKFRVAQHDAGLGPEASLPDLMAVTVFDATWIGLLFASIVALAGFVTIQLLTVKGSADAKGRVSVASEPGARSGARGPREGPPSPRLLRGLAGALRAEADASRGGRGAKPPDET